MPSIAVVLHLYYPELWPEIFGHLRSLIGQKTSVTRSCDLFVSLAEPPAHARVTADILRDWPNAQLFWHPNVGRDMAPFIALLQSGRLDQYHAVCKLHSKKTEGSLYGTLWRRDLYRSLLGNPEAIIQAFATNPQLGVIGPAGSYLNTRPWVGPNRAWLKALLDRLPESLSPDSPSPLDQPSFFAGSMFWFRPAALAGLKAWSLQPPHFGEELGQMDGTLAHALERLILPLAQRAGYAVAFCDAPRHPIDPHQRHHDHLQALEDFRSYLTLNSLKLSDAERQAIATTPASLKFQIVLVTARAAEKDTADEQRTLASLENQPYRNVTIVPIVPIVPTPGSPDSAPPLPLPLPDSETLTGDYLIWLRSGEELFEPTLAELATRLTAQRPTSTATLPVIFRSGQAGSSTISADNSGITPPHFQSGQVLFPFLPCQRYGPITSGTLLVVNAEYYRQQTPEKRFPHVDAWLEALCPPSLGPDATHPVGILPGWFVSPLADKPKKERNPSHTPVSRPTPSTTPTLPSDEDIGPPSALLRSEDLTTIDQQLRHMARSGTQVVVILSPNIELAPEHQTELIRRLYQSPHCRAIAPWIEDAQGQLAGNALIPGCDHVASGWGEDRPARDFVKNAGPCTPGALTFHALALRPADYVACGGLDPTLDGPAAVMDFGLRLQSIHPEKDYLLWCPEISANYLATPMPYPLAGIPDNSSQRQLLHRWQSALLDETRPFHYPRHLNRRHPYALGNSPNLTRWSPLTGVPSIPRLFARLNPRLAPVWPVPVLENLIAQGKILADVGTDWPHDLDLAGFRPDLLMVQSPLGEDDLARMEGWFRYHPYLLVLASPETDSDPVVGSLRERQPSLRVCRLGAPIIEAPPPYRPLLQQLKATYEACYA